MKLNYKCASYCRLSREDENKLENASSSIINQKAIIRKYAFENDLLIVDEYVDDGFSGGNFERPSFQLLLEDIKKGKINCVITKDLSRLGREIYETGTYIERYFIENGVRYIAINDNYDSENGDQMLAIRLGLNDLYLRDISKKIKSSFKVKQQNGEYIGSFPLYGYMKDPNNRHKLIIDKEVSDIVKLIYNLYLNGKGTSQIADILTDKKIPIPIVHKKEPRANLVKSNNGIGTWRHATVKSILTNEMYIGNMVQNTYKKVSYNNKKIIQLDKEEYVIVKNTHEAIINKEDFYNVQKLIKSGKGNRGVKNTYDYLLKGLLRCADCGKRLSIIKGNAKSNNYKYTCCNNYKKSYAIKQCSPHRVNYTLLEKDIIMYLKQYSKKFLENYNSNTLAIKINELKKGDIKKTEKEIIKLKNQIESNEQKLKTMYKDKLDGLLTTEMFINYSKEIKDYNSKIKDKLEILKINSKEILNKNDNLDETKKVIEDYIKLKKPTKEIIHKIIDYIEIDETKKINIYLKMKPLKLNNGYNKCHE